MTFLKKFIQNESGATAIEYGLIAALIAVGLIVVLNNVGDSLETNFTTISNELNQAGGR